MWATRQGHAITSTTDGWKSYAHNFSPPSVTNRGTKCGWYLERTLVNFWKSATLLRVRSSRSLSLRSREWIISTRCCLWDHVMTPSVGLASSLTKAVLESMRSSRWTLLTDNVRIWAVFRGRTSPNSGPISAVTTTQSNMLDLIKTLIMVNSSVRQSPLSPSVSDMHVHASTTSSHSVSSPLVKGGWVPI